MRSTIDRRISPQPHKIAADNNILTDSSPCCHQLLQLPLDLHLMVAVGGTTHCTSSPPFHQHPVHLTQDRNYFTSCHHSFTTYKFTMPDSRRHQMFTMSDLSITKVNHASATCNGIHQAYVHYISATPHHISVSASHQAPAPSTTEPFTSQLF
jgi:hypothetical protein